MNMLEEDRTTTANQRAADEIVMIHNLNREPLVQT